MNKPSSRNPRKRFSEFSLPETSDDAIASSFATNNEHAFCYVRDWLTWLTWDGSSWKKSARDPVFETIRSQCRKLAAQEPDPRKAERLLSSKKFAAVEMLARSDRLLSVDAGCWDVDPWLLNTQDGIVDLRSGEKSPHDPRHHLLKQTHASAQGACPRWHHFVNTVTGGRTDLAAYLQRIAGYSLTGSTAEQVFFYFWGTGANGKSVFANTISEIMGSYAIAAAPGMLAAAHRDRHPTEIAMLRNARLVIASEIEKGSPLAENKLKMLTGSDRLTARRMHQDFSEFAPSFKLLMIGNGLPAIRDADEAMRRRIHIVPFDITVPEDQRNIKLMDELLEEADGILQWMLEGCLAWQREGLAMPACVRDLTIAHFNRSDPLGTFIASACDLNSAHSSGSTELFHKWCEWPGALNSALQTQKAFVSALQARGFRRVQTADKRLIAGLRLKADSKSNLQ